MCIGFSRMHACQQATYYSLCFRVRKKYDIKFNALLEHASALMCFSYFSKRTTTPNRTMSVHRLWRWNFLPSISHSFCIVLHRKSSSVFNSPKSWQCIAHACIAYIWIHNMPYAVLMHCQVPILFTFDFDLYYYYCCKSKYCYAASIDIYLYSV